MKRDFRLERIPFALSRSDDEIRAFLERNGRELSRIDDEGGVRVAWAWRRL